MEVEKIIGRGSGFVAVEIPFTPRAKRVLELSLEEARQLGADAHLMRSTFQRPAPGCWSCRRTSTATLLLSLRRDACQAEWHCDCPACVHAHACSIADSATWVSTS